MTAGGPRARSRTGPVAAMSILAAGGGLAVFAGSRAWDRVSVTRAAPLAGFSVDVVGRAVEPAVTGLGVVALAGVLAVLATRARARRVIGAVLMLAGVVLGWRAAAGLSAVSVTRARDLVAQARTGTALDATTGVRIEVHRAGPAMAVLAAALVVVGGALIVARAGRWSVLGARYEPPPGSARAADGSVPPDPGATQVPADLVMWKSLDRGEDPTA